MLPLLVVALIGHATAYCNNVKALSPLTLDNVYGMWFGVGYVQHLPDWSDVPSTVGCVVLHVSDVTHETRPDWAANNSLIRYNWTTAYWRSPKSNPLSDAPLSGSWLDVPFKNIQQGKRDLGSREPETEGISRVSRTAQGEVRPGEVGRARVLWDEDGHSQERTYEYHVTVPGAWTRRGGREDDPSHPEYINIMHSTPHMLVLNYCSERGGGRHFSLVLRRSAQPLQRWNWQAVKGTLARFNVPHVYRLAAVCAAAAPLGTPLALLLAFWLCSSLK